MTWMVLAFVTAQFEFGSGVSFLQTATASAETPTAQGGGDISPEPPPSPITARFIPLSLGSSEAQTGSGVEAGTWHVEVCNRGPDTVIPRALIMETVPLRYLPPEFVPALLTQRTNRSKAAIAKEVLRYLGLAGGLAASILGSQGGAVAGLVAANVLDYGPRIAAAIPAPDYSLPNPLPVEVFLRAGTCGEYNILAARVRGAAVMGPYTIRQ